MTFDRRAVSKALSAIARASVDDVLAAAVGERPRSARVIGITGSPGVGKSTLIGRLAQARLAQARSIAVVAIDPTSPRTEGSLLGDRVRMAALSEDPRVYIRSLPSGSAEDGLTDNLPEIVALLDSFGFDEILIETVGAGQTAYGVRAIADLELLVLAPGAGDYVQAMKAGIMETADLFVVNKAELPGADRVAGDLIGAAMRDGQPVPVVQVRADAADGLAQLDALLTQHFAALAARGPQTGSARARNRYRVRALLLRRIQERLRLLPEETWDAPLVAAYDAAAAGLLPPRSR
jgi:LAO/AO transport system kinase